LKRAIRVGPALQEVVALCSTDCSFRGVADFLARMYNRAVLSHEGIRQMVHRVAAGIKAEQARVCARPEGRERRKALFVGADGLMVHLQRAKQRVREVKLRWRLRGGRGGGRGRRSGDWCGRCTT